jgi:cyclophilin family peptidyl-prolyl cis-trans isomerase
MRRFLVIAPALLALAGCGGSSKQAATTTAPAASVPTTTAPATGGCTTVPRPAPKTGIDQKPPKSALDAAKTWDVVVQTNCGSFTIRLDVKDSPKTTASFVSLARNGFFDKTIFHRIVPAFVIQGGDPTQSGAGGPGYSTVDKPPATTEYTKGVVAMAKTQSEAPGTSGSQFFVVTARVVSLPPDYAVLGKVVAGEPVVDRIGKLGDAAEHPTKVVEIQHMTVKES